MALLSSRDPQAHPEPEPTTLDDPKTPDAAGPPPATPPTPSPRANRGGRRQPPGFRAQIGSTRDAVMALVMAHVDLAKAELGAIVSEVGRVAALGGLAIVLVIAALLLAIIGTSLFLGEWLLGSMGWGILHGVLAFLDIAVAAVLLALGVSVGRVGRSFLVGVVTGVLVGILLALNLPNQLYTALGEMSGMAVEPGIRPLVVGMLFGGLVGLVAGILSAVLMNAAAGGRFVALAGLTVLGVAVGAFTAITFSVQVGAALGITVFYITWIVFMAMDIARTGIDLDALKARFYPGTTIDTSKETLEWLQKRMPPGIGS
jgi:hypothetical protein